MGKRHASERDNGEIEFTRGGTDALEDVTEGLRMLHAVGLYDTHQRGVLELVVTFYHCERERASKAVVTVRGTWPNANGTSFGAFFFQQCNKAAIMANAWHKSFLEEEASRKP